MKDNAMRAAVVYGAILIGVLALAIMARPRVPLASVPEQTGEMTLPADYRTQFIAYAVVDRPDNITRTLYISPESYAALQRGAPLPNGTRIIIEAYNGTNADRGEMIPYIHMAEKRASWRLDELHTSAKVGDWNFASFEAATGQPTDPNTPGENLNDCFTCHDSNASPTRDFIFTRQEIDSFTQSQSIQYFICDQPERIPCRFRRQG